MRIVLGLAASCLLAGPASAQSAEHLMAVGDSLSRALRPDSALVLFRKAMTIDTRSPRPLWKTGIAMVDVAKQWGNDRRAQRDSMYRAAAELGWLAIGADTNDADAHFLVALALGRLALTQGGKERVRFGNFIQMDASKAITLRPNHDGAHHVLGAFHAEVQRLSPISRFFAKTFFGARILAFTNWDSAQVHLERAVAIDSTYIFHRLELAEILIDRKRFAEAKTQLAAIAKLPPTSDVLDPMYQKEAERLLEKIRNKK